MSTMRAFRVEWMMLLACGALAACGGEGLPSTSDVGGGGPTGGGGAEGDGGSPSSSGSDVTTSTVASSAASGVSTSSSSTSSTSSTSVSASVASTSTGGGCSIDAFFGDPECDACALGSCCPEVEACVDDFDLCIDGNAIDPSSQLGAPLIACLEESCTEACTDGGVCGGGITWGDDAIDACLEGSCCDEMDSCTSDGQEADLCLDCLLDGAGLRCNPFLACAEEAGCFGGGGCADGEFTCDDGGCIPGEWECDQIVDCRDASDEDCGAVCGADEFTCDDGGCIPASYECDDIVDCDDGSDEDCGAVCGADEFTCDDGGCVPASYECDDFVDCDDGSDESACGVCDSGIYYQSAEVTACLGDACCDEYRVCTSNGTQVQECIDCFNAGGGSRCDAAMACAEASGCFDGLGTGICDSGLSSGDDAVDACLSDVCCEDFSACTLGGTDIQGCLDCFDAGGGPRCDAASTCYDSSGC